MIVFLRWSPLVKYNSFLIFTVRSQILLIASIFSFSPLMQRAALSCPQLALSPFRNIASQKSKRFFVFNGSLTNLFCKKRRAESSALLFIVR